MPRPPRAAQGNMVYHVINRANARMTIFNKDADYLAFEKTLTETKEGHPMRIMAYCLMPNHWHLVLYPETDEAMPLFMHWLTLTHTQRWHVAHKTVGYGHLYQGRYKAFPIQKDEHFLQVVRYVERNPKRAAFVKKAENWRWSSLHRRESGKIDSMKLLSSWPVKPDSSYLQWVNEPQPKEEVEVIRYAIKRGRPYGEENWIDQTAKSLGLESTLRARGRPSKGS
jgi:putative transposase